MEPIRVCSVCSFTSWVARWRLSGWLCWTLSPNTSGTCWCSVPPSATFSTCSPRQIANIGTSSRSARSTSSSSRASRSADTSAVLGCGASPNRDGSMSPPPVSTRPSSRAQRASRAAADSCGASSTGTPPACSTARRYAELTKARSGYSSIVIEVETPIRGAGIRSDETREYRGGHALSQRRVRLEESSDVGEIFLAFAGAPCRIGRRPDLALQEILDVRHRQPNAENLTLRCPLDEVGVPGIGLKLNAEIRIGGRDVEAVFETLEPESSSECRLGQGKLLHRDGQVEVEAHDRLDVCVHRLTADDAELDAVLAQQRNDAVEELAAVEGHGLPERSRPHDRCSPMVKICASKRYHAPRRRSGIIPAMSLDSASSQQSAPTYRPTATVPAIGPRGAAAPATPPPAQPGRPVLAAAGY